ncbi:hypothetical protein Taro_038589 [Colocasia esculenta]|uniref:RNase H type-1 domain-containing protein n=1 Tax=Colocasia esculenta TaxID=4460 RepID=A0A843WD94_COLES|nr:hypothetical protein [Colocasia esculenta]
MLSIRAISLAFKLQKLSLPWLTALRQMTSGDTGGEGILHDHKGNMSCAFTKAYHGLNLSLAAEVLALKDGLSICCSKGLSEVMVETDSLNLL